MSLDFEEITSPCLECLDFGEINLAFQVLPSEIEYEALRLQVLEIKDRM